MQGEDGEGAPLEYEAAKRSEWRGDESEGQDKAGGDGAGEGASPSAKGDKAAPIQTISPPD